MNSNEVSTTYLACCVQSKLTVIQLNLFFHLDLLSITFLQIGSFNSDPGLSKETIVETSLHKKQKRREEVLEWGLDIFSKICFILERWLNGQRQQPGWIQFRHDKIQDWMMERKTDTMSKKTNIINVCKVKLVVSMNKHSHVYWKNKGHLMPQTKKKFAKKYAKVWKTKFLFKGSS